MRPPTLSLTLVIFNMPVTWRREDIKTYLEHQCGSIENVQLLQSHGDYGTFRVQFATVLQLHLAKLKLYNKTVNGRKLIVSYEYTDEDNNIVPLRNSAPYVDAWEEDPVGMYGLRIEYLSSLNITPPINEWVNVTNFDCDKVQLKELLEMAGHILFFTVKDGVVKCAKVMFSHPLEAVQAISMFNGRTFYGQQICVVMNKESEENILPDGLENLGPGLGKNGKPIKDIARQYDRFVKKQSNLINSHLFVDINEYSGSNEDYGQVIVNSDSNVDMPPASVVNEETESYDANTNPITVENDPPVLRNKLVLNPLSIMHNAMKELEVINHRSEESVPVLSTQDVLSPNAPNPVPVAVNSKDLILPDTTVPPPQVLPQNTNVQLNPRPQPIVTVQHVVPQPQNLWPDSEYQQVPPPSVISNKTGSHLVIPNQSGHETLVPNQIGFPTLVPNLGPQTLGPNQIEPQTIVQYQMGPQTLIPNQIRPQVLASNQIGPPALAPIQVGSQSLVPNQIEPQAINPNQNGSQALVPNQIGNQTLATNQIGSQPLVQNEIDHQLLVPNQIDQQLLVPNQILPQVALPENGIIPNMSVAQNHVWGFQPHRPAIVHTTSKAPYLRNEHVCVANLRELRRPNVSNPVMRSTRFEPYSNVLHHLLPNVSNHTMRPARPEMPTTVILNNIPPSPLGVLVERLTQCGQVLALHCPHPRRAIATYARPEEAVECFKIYHGYLASDRRIDVTFA